MKKDNRSVGFLFTKERLPFSAHNTVLHIIILFVSFDYFPYCSGKHITTDFFVSVAVEERNPPL